MLTKICGIATLTAAQAARAAGADWIGFVFANSRRKINVETARRIALQTPGIGKVGVFVNAPLAEVQDIVRECRLDFVQLHGEETAAYCAQLHVPVIKAFRANGAYSPEALAEINAYPAQWILLDSAVNGQFGGVGVPFDWENMRQFRKQLRKPVIMAGGLDCVNVRDAIRILQPDGVDVSGGVETNGVKDLDKIREFVRKVRRGGAVYVKRNS